MLGERDIQWFCSEDQHEAQADATPPFDLEPVEKTFWEEWEQACETDADCPRPDLGQVCTMEVWHGTTDASSYSTGHGCYNYEHQVCPGPTFAIENYNYDNTGWSAYAQYWCTSGSGASALVAAATIAILTNFV